MRVMAQMAMVMNLDKCIGCHTCSVTCKQAWTNRTGVEYVWFNNVEEVAAKRIGRETVQYVSNIYKYYITINYCAYCTPLPAQQVSAFPWTLQS